jgi:hypothetical protein
MWKIYYLSEREGMMIATITMYEENFNKAVDKVLSICVENDGEDSCTRDEVKEAFQKTLEEHISNILEEPEFYFFDYVHLGSEFSDWLKTIQRRKAKSTI